MSTDDIKITVHGRKATSDVETFRRWFWRSRPGDVMVYHVGDLMYDRFGRSDGARKVFEMAETAWDYFSTGEVHLLQQRVSRSCFEYIAVRTNPRNSEIIAKKLKRPLSASEVQALGRIKRPAIWATT